MSQADPPKPQRGLIVQLTTVHRSDDVRIYWRIAAAAASFGFRSMVVGPKGVAAPLADVDVVDLPVGEARPLRMLLGPVRAFNTVRALRPDVVQIHDPELLILVPLLRLIGASVIYDAHEDYSAVLGQRAWIPKVMRPLAASVLGGCERMMARRASAVVAATPAIGRRFADAVLVQNFADVSGPKQFPRRRFASEDPFRLAYVGELSDRRGARQMADAVGVLAARRPVHLVVAGVVKPPSLIEELIRRSAGNIRFCGWLDQAGVAALLGESDAGVVAFLPGPNHDESQPRKLFEYMAAGLPVVASDLPRWREIVYSHRCGVLMDPADPYSIVQAVEQLADAPDLSAQMGSRGREAVRLFYSWQSQLEVLGALYERLFSERCRGDRGVWTTHCRVAWLRLRARNARPGAPASR